MGKPRRAWLDYFVIGAAMTFDLPGSFALPHPFPRNRARSVAEALRSDMTNVGGDLTRAIRRHR
jgi:hypothetical protein